MRQAKDCVCRGYESIIIFFRITGKCVLNLNSWCYAKGTWPNQYRDNQISLLSIKRWTDRSNDVSPCCTCAKYFDIFFVFGELRSPIFLFHFVLTIFWHLTSADSTSVHDSVGFSIVRVLKLTIVVQLGFLVLYLPFFKMVRVDFVYVRSP